MPETTAGTAGDRPSAGTTDGRTAAGRPSLPDGKSANPGKTPVVLKTPASDSKHAAVVWPFAAAVLLAALVLFTYAALPHPPGWLTAR